MVLQGFRWPRETLRARRRPTIDPLRSPARIPIHLKGIFWGSQMRWTLRGAEVWMGTEYLGEISAEWLALQVEREIRDRASSHWFQREMEPQRLGLHAHAPAPPPTDQKAHRRAARRRRNKGSAP